MTDLLVFSKMGIEGGGENEGEHDDENEREQPIVVGGLSVTGLLKRKKNDLTDSKLYSFFENLAVPIGLTCYRDENEGGSTDGQKDEFNDGVIKSDLFDRLFNMSSINLTRGKTRKTRKKIPQ
jgi:hypothetical protein